MNLFLLCPMLNAADPLWEQSVGGAAWSRRSTDGRVFLKFPIGIQPPASEVERVSGALMDHRGFQAEILGSPDLWDPV